MYTLCEFVPIEWFDVSGEAAMVTREGIGFGWLVHAVIFKL